MIRYMHLQMACLLLLGLTACPPPPEPIICDWDHEIAPYNAVLAMELWKAKWQDSIPYRANIPDSFVISRPALEEMVGDNCGFRVSYAMTEAGNFRSMGILLNAIDASYNMPDSSLYLLYADSSSLDNFNLEGGDNAPLPLVEEVRLDIAILRQEMWSLYNGTCLEDDTLGNPSCLQGEQGAVPAWGYLPDTIRQIIPVSQAYAANNTLAVLDSVYPGYEGLLFICGLFPADKDESDHTTTGTSDTNSIFLRYDFVVEAYGHTNGQLTTMSIPNSKGENLQQDLYLDLSCPCPGSICCPESEL